MMLDKMQNLICMPIKMTRNYGLTTSAIINDFIKLRLQAERRGHLNSNQH